MAVKLCDYLRSNPEHHAIFVLVVAIRQLLELNSDAWCYEYIT